MNKMILSILVLIIAGSLVFAQPPQEVTYQGYLTDNASQPITANLQLSFTLYDAQSGGTALWSEVHPSVAIIEGVFRVSLGKHNPARIEF